ncbi:keratin-associated protein 5-4 [Venturia canescens]|uniref:keratin-associated protein 5-4 n=1 Tax=Venturia canescens TaxID=32260 RepID=UPI001C9BC76D|nr:keratin-associated protein 5-4 [Venturia canescens]
MLKNLVFASFIVVALVVVGSATGCKVCGNPWCSAEDIHERIELSIIEPAGKRHCWPSHDEPCSCGAPKCSHPKCEPDCHHGHCGGCKCHSRDCKECSKDCCKSHCKDCKECSRDCCKDCSKDCPKDCGCHKCHGKDSKACYCSQDHRSGSKLECKCKVKHRHDC